MITGSILIPLNVILMPDLSLKNSAAVSNHFSSNYCLLNAYEQISHSSKIVEEFKEVVKTTHVND